MHPGGAAVVPQRPAERCPTRCFSSAEGRSLQPSGGCVGRRAVGGFRSLFAAFPWRTLSRPVRSVSPRPGRVPAQGRPSPRGSRAPGLAVPGTSPLDVPPHPLPGLKPKACLIREACLRTNGAPVNPVEGVLYFVYNNCIVLTRPTSLIKAETPTIQRPRVVLMSIGGFKRLPEYSSDLRNLETFQAER